MPGSISNRQWVSAVLFFALIAGGTVALRRKPSSIPGLKLYFTRAESSHYRITPSPWAVELALSPPQYLEPLPVRGASLVERIQGTPASVQAVVQDHDTVKLNIATGPDRLPSPLLHPNETITLQPPGVKPVQARLVPAAVPNPAPFHVQYNTTSVQVDVTETRNQYSLNLRNQSEEPIATVALRLDADVDRPEHAYMAIPPGVLIPARGHVVVDIPKSGSPAAGPLITTLGLSFTDGSVEGNPNAVNAIYNQYQSRLKYGRRIVAEWNRMLHRWWLPTVEQMRVTSALLPVSEPDIQQARFAREDLNHYLDLCSRDGDLRILKQCIADLSAAW